MTTGPVVALEEDAASPAATSAGSGKVLILAQTVSGGLGSLEAQHVTAQGLTPEIVDGATWAAMTTAQFSSYRAIVLGDPNCGNVSPAVAENNAAVWGAAVDGNIVINGTDPVYHGAQGGAIATRKFLDFAVADPAKTGAYISLSCYYHGTGASTSVPLLDALQPGGFSVTGVGCFNDAHIVASHPAIDGLTDADLSNWSCSVHEGFDRYPADWSVLAIARNIGSSFTGPDGSVGTPYILASGNGLRSFPLSLSPVDSTGASGTKHSITAALLDKDTRGPVSGQRIAFAVVDGPNTGVTTGVCGSCTTDSAGQTIWTYPSNSANGTDRIAAWIDTDGDKVIDAGEPQAFAARTWIGPARPTRYVALGDSFQSGEGAYEYESGTDTEANPCHRSSVSYPYLLAGADGVPPVTQSVACSGAVIRNFTDGQHTEGPQYGALSQDVRLVTVGIGGNDLGFASVLKACVLGPQLSGDFFSVTQTCHGRFEEQINTALKKLTTKVLDDSDGVSLSPLQHVYNKIHARSAQARILVIGYPHLFTPEGRFFGCQLVYRVDQKWMNSKIDQFNKKLKEAATSMGAEFASGSSVFDDHELCSGNTEYLNGLVGIGDTESFHPNAAGHRRIAQVLLTQIQGPAANGRRFIIKPFQMVTSPFLVPFGSNSATFSLTWPGSDIEVSLTDPAGRRYTRSTSDVSVFHRLTPTSELYTIADPMPGDWTVSMYGADVAADGEPAELSSSTVGRSNQPPVAAATATANGAGTTVTYDASRSSDADGSIVTYEWDFGDGTGATGPVVTHTYAKLGTLSQPSLRVIDNDGAEDFMDVPHVVSHYGFSGFAPPVRSDNSATMTVGSTLPIKFALTNPDGSAQVAMNAVSSFSASRSGASFTLTVDEGQYMLQMKTPRGWAPGRVDILVKLNDRSVRTVRVTLK